MNLSFLYTDFKEKAFRFIIDKKDLTDEIEKMLNKEEVKEFIYIEKDNHFLITFNKKEYKISKNPISFKSFLDKNLILFKIFTEEDLSSVIYLLKSTYGFLENDKVIQIENIKFNSTKEIVLVPYLYTIFVKLSWENSGLKELKEFDELEIDPFILEPYLKLIDENKTMKKFNLIINKERINFIETIVEYINLKNTNEPMIIIGNDGIGKSVSLQYLSNLNLDYPVLYFNFKMMEIYDLIEYISLEIMKGFLNRKSIDYNNCNNEVFSETIKKNFGKYIDFLKNFREIAFNKSFWDILYIIFSDDLLKKSVLIFDQFKNESKFYDGYDKFISFNRMRKIILCYTLNDSYNKETFFSMLNNATSMILGKNYFCESKESNLQNDNDDNKKKDEEEDIDETNYFKNFTIFQDYLNRDIKLDDKQNNKTKNQDKENQKDIPIDDVKEQKDLLNKKRKKIRRKDENIMLYQLAKEEIKNNKNEQMQKVKKLYYNSLINIKDIIQDKDIKECLYYFNYSPKYYSKFLKFQKKQKENGITNIKNIIQNFYEDQFEKINNNINKFYLNINNRRKTDKLPLLNPIENLIKLKKVVENRNEINFFKLSEYSKIFCFKYLYLSECNSNSEDKKKNECNKEDKKKYFIDLNEKDNKRVFTLNYSFLFIKIVNEKIINNLMNNNNIVEINQLSGSAFGNALELKFKEEIVEHKYFNKIFIYKKVWNFEILDNNLKKSKYDEYLAKKQNSNNPKFHIIEKLDDILDYNCKFILNDNYYYISPKNQINKNFDSLMLIKTTQEHEYNMIIFQHTKYKDKRKIKTKSTYKKYAEKKVKPKFEELYNIKIVKIYFIFILSNEHEENDETCTVLKENKIGYLFYSIEKKEIYKQRSTEKIKNLSDLMNPNYLIFPNEDNDNKDYTFNMQMINTIENIIKDKLKNKEKINYEKIRKEIIPYSAGPKINIDLKKKIISGIIKNSYNLFDFIFYASTPYTQLSFNTALENDLFLIFKINNIIYLYYHQSIFVIDVKKNSIIEKQELDIFNLLKFIHKDGKNIFIIINNGVELKDIPDLNKGESNIFIFKIYKMSLKTNVASK